MRAHVRPGKRPLAGKTRSLAECPAVASSSMPGCMDKPAPVCVGVGWSPCCRPDLEK